MLTFEKETNSREFGKKIFMRLSNKHSLAFVEPNPDFSPRNLVVGKAKVKLRRYEKYRLKAQKM